MFSDVVLIKTSLYAAIAVASGLVAILFIAAVRLLTDIWIIGFASTAIGILTLVVGQALIVSLIGIFVRSQRPMSLVVDSHQYLAAVERVSVVQPREVDRVT